MSGSPGGFPGQVSASEAAGRRSPDPLPHSEIDFVLGFAIGEDLGPGDVTTDELIPLERPGLGRLISKAQGVVSGLDVFGRVFELIDDRVQIEFLVQDGDRIWPGDELLRIKGNARSLLIGERTALNFVQRMSGIATETFRFVDAVEGRVRICDTRKTTPGLRQFEKYAVECGGAINHRFGLFDEVMVKNNHIDLAGSSLVELLFALRASHGEDMRMTAEARNEAEAFDGVAGGADCVLLDNMSPATMSDLCPRLRAAAAKQGRTIEIEASGGIDLTTVVAVSHTGVDRISVGALTHSAPALDLSLGIEVHK
ncbi:MAG: nicotinate-nucleotide pyrophosphorylase (carboxylating) [Gammaproteobacteria bacterium]|jgi:nicotinate-nucleotide pyrophosphorylase (carboxylating)